MKKILLLLFIILALPAHSKDINNCDNYSNNINFKNDEKTFVFLAFLNLFNKKDNYNLESTNYDKDYYTDIYNNYKNNIKNTKDIYMHHKLDERKIKDSVFMFDARLYSSVETGFQIDNALNDEDDRLLYLPSSDTIRDFYTNLNLYSIWKNKVEKENQVLIEKYRDKSIQIINDISCFLRTTSKYPIDIIFQKSNYFNLLGQSYFSNLENKYIIKVFISDDLKEEDILKTIRHEYTHLVLNEEIKRNSSLIENKLNSFYERIPEAKILYPEELIAKCMEDINYYKSKDFIVDMIFYYNKNPLYRHFINKIPEYLSSNKSFNEFIPELFYSFSANREIDKYIDIRNKLFKKG